MDNAVFKALAAHLERSGGALATAESCTGGLIAHTLTEIAGASAYFQGGVVAYSNAIKERLLGVPEAVLLAHGAVSGPTARAMVEGVIRLFDAECAIAVTGIAGPGGGSAEKPVGLVYIGVSAGGNIAVSRHQFSGTRTAIKEATAQTAARLLLELLRGPDTANPEE